MHFLHIDKLLPVEDERDLYVFWLAALAFRRSHKHLDKELANYVFLRSNEARTVTSFDSVMDDIAYEFASLETPPATTREANKSWTRLESIVNKAFQKFA